MTRNLLSARAQVTHAYEQEKTAVRHSNELKVRGGRGRRRPTASRTNSLPP